MRNVLVDDNELCKVGDFGLLWELPSDSTIYVPQSDDLVPCCWLSLESLTDRRFSVASDVWSYGIVMWEMFEPTKISYEEFGPYQIVSKLKEGYRLHLVHLGKKSQKVVSARVTSAWYTALYGQAVGLQLELYRKWLRNTRGSLIINTVSSACHTMLILNRTYEEINYLANLITNILHV